MNSQRRSSPEVGEGREWAARAKAIVKPAPPGRWPPSPRQARRGRVQQSATGSKVSKQRKNLNDVPPPKWGRAGRGPPGRKFSGSQPLPAVGHPPRDKLGEGESNNLQQAQKSANSGKISTTFLPQNGGGQGGGRRGESSLEASPSRPLATLPEASSERASPTIHSTFKSRQTKENSKRSSSLILRECAVTGHP